MGTIVNHFSKPSIHFHAFIGLLIRLIFIFYGDHQDKTQLVKYTDIDYHVFTDAARYVVNSLSPYNRHTYRYTPLLAVMLMPNVTLHHMFGKFIFSIFDVIATLLIHRIVKHDLKEGGDDKVAKWCAFLWLYNPLAIVVSTRGNAESLMAVLVLATLYLFKTKRIIESGVVYGLAVHFKIYPITFSLPLYLALGKSKTIYDFFSINVERVKLITSTIVTVTTVTGICYWCYGEAFLNNAYLYHITRRDTRHNFSVYFYFLYLLSDLNDVGTSVFIGLVTFVPQIVLLIAFSIAYGSMQDLPFCVFAHTFLFVTFNKVCTSQYFLWYLALLPPCLPKLSLSVGEGIALLLVWFFAQGSWLLPAYFLEFEGKNTFLYIWLESIAFFCANVGIFAKIMRSYNVAQHFTKPNENKKLISDSLD